MMTRAEYYKRQYEKLLKTVNDPEGVDKLVKQNVQLEAQVVSLSQFLDGLRLATMKTLETQTPKEANGDLG